ncbi:MAG: hypothetical protein QME59_00840 [Candidatus Hydrothermarchaeota archaeon]|nr:hypothetical protein [Candidatus Hydrothermarchaeota archaeon]
MRTAFDIAKEIFEVLYGESPLLKTELAKKVGLNTDSLNQWIDIIEFVQRQPRFLKKKIGKRIEVVDLEKEEIKEEITPEIVEAMIEFEKHLRKVEEAPQKKEENVVA